MTQSQLDEMVAAALGSELREVRRLGFSLVGMSQVDLDEDHEPMIVDWDEVDRNRRS